MTTNKEKLKIMQIDFDKTVPGVWNGVIEEFAEYKDEILKIINEFHFKNNLKILSDEHKMTRSLLFRALFIIFLQQTICENINKTLEKGVEFTLSLLPKCVKEEINKDFS